MNKNLRLKIEESIELKVFSKNLGVLCLSRLIDTISSSSNDTTSLEKQRDIIAKALLNNGVTKKEISEMLYAIIKDDYPTFKSINKVVAMLEENKYFFETDFIKTKGHIHFKTTEEIEADRNKTPVIKKKTATNQDYTMLKVYIENDILREKTSDSFEKIILKIKTFEQPYDYILRAVKMYRSDIMMALDRKERNVGFDNSYSRDCFLCGVIHNYVEEYKTKMEKEKKDEDKFWLDNAKDVYNKEITIEEAIAYQCDKYENSCYYGQHEYVKQKILEGLEKIKLSEKAKEKAEHTDLSIITEVDVDYFSFEHEKPKEIPERLRCLL